MVHLTFEVGSRLTGHEECAISIVDPFNLFLFRHQSKQSIVQLLAILNIALEPEPRKMKASGWFWLMMQNTP
jgi:hypothetical protein